MDEETRAAKLALARRKLKDHQEKKTRDHFSKDDDNMDSNNISPSDKLNTVRDNMSTKAGQNDDIPSEKLQTANVTASIDKSSKEEEMNATEILITSERNLELQNNELKTKLSKLESDYSIAIQQYNNVCQKVYALENELKNVSYNYQTMTEQLNAKDNVIKELHEAKLTLSDEKSNMQEQLEFTKTVLQAKQSENNSLHSQLYNIQSQLDASQLQLQQLTSGTSSSETDDIQSLNTLKHENEILQQKISTLEQQLKTQIRDYQQINTHYESFVGELNNQLKTVSKRNEELQTQLHNLSNRESSLVEQISEMEIRLQNYSSVVKTTSDQDSTFIINELETNYKSAQIQIQELNFKYEELENLYAKAQAEIKALSQQPKDAECEDDGKVSLSKLSADITSDKVAVQRATEQNKKLKEDIKGLEDAFVKMTKDKLELTEKLTAEKYLNRELTIKLAEIDEKAKDMQKTLKAKDEEMIRLQASYRELVNKYQELESSLKNFEDHTDHETTNLIHEPSKETEYEDIASDERKMKSSCLHSNGNTMPKYDAMSKLQERFLKIMSEVADLSDEKHRLEHIITQLQNETDTICEYVALYQQQRSLLNKRDEERNAQIKIFQTECKRLQSQLDELTDILRRFAEDKQLSSYFEIQSKQDDIQKVMSILLNLKTNSIIDPENKMEFTNLYPCNCCSGKLIEV